MYEHTAVQLDSEREKLNTEVSAYNEVSRKPKQIQTTQIQSYLKSEVSAYKEVPRRLKHMRTEFLVGSGFAVRVGRSMRVEFYP